jgi:deoxyribodipyrimidine photolyase-related protein
LPAKERVPARLRFAPDATTREVIDLVRRRFPDHPGRLEPFEWAVDRSGAERALADFVDVGLPRFGDYQDAMKEGAPYLFHGLVSPYLNVGLLDARECCEAAIGAYRAGRAPLAATEGFVRQILGWREYVRGVYWQAGPSYAASNALGATRPLPDLYWTGETELACLRACVRDTLDRAYAHHIQRLMVLGNFALLAGVAPSELEAWFLAVYADAFEWVELPNVHGMALYADGGLLASKPYAASGAYVDRMSDYCQSCQYSPKEREGERACPLNALYWDFVDRNREALGGNPRMAMPYKNLDAMPAARREQVRRDAARFLARLAPPSAGARGDAS